MHGLRVLRDGVWVALVRLAVLLIYLNPCVSRRLVRQLHQHCLLAEAGEEAKLRQRIRRASSCRAVRVV